MKEKNEVLNPCAWLTLLVVPAYLAGAIPWGLIIVRYLKHIDIRTIGSGNIGATNVSRAAGTPAALLTLLLDALKGAVPVLALRLVASECDFAWQWVAAAGTVAAITGHMFPIYLRFRPSGKGVSTAFGCFLVLAPWAALSALATFILVAGFSRKSSLGSLTGTLALLPAIWISTHDGVLMVGALISMGLIFLRHAENIRRLLRGKESSLNDR
jgi:acyl phosphate:glycerol-3-phosphate acyltransferase